LGGLPHGLDVDLDQLPLGMEPFVEKSFDPALARALVRRAAELGINCFDTAEVYGFGRGERLLGQALAAEGVTSAVMTSKSGSQLPLPAADDITALRTAIEAVAARVRRHEEQIRQLNRKKK
jgi:aryl-alcohol dehydrogenase-like predicted oxidoreductase